MFCVIATQSINSEIPENFELSAYFFKFINGKFLYNIKSFKHSYYNTSKNA